MSKEEHSQISVRKEKLAALQQAGVPHYPNEFRPRHTLEDLLTRFGQEQNGEVLAGIEVCVAGRIILYRHFGKLVFATLRDATADMQVAVQRDEVGETLYTQVFRKLDVGDWIGVEGHLFRTKTGELTVRVARFQLLAKGLRPLPEKWHGLEDIETRYRQRYLDLIVNPEVRTLFRTRSKIVRLIRDAMEAQGFLEVETPMMHPIPGGAVARPFITHHNALDRDLYLRIAPELYLKRLIVGGFDKVFEINRNFRNEGLSTRHNPEFTMMEFYQAFTDYEELMTFVERLICQVVAAIHPEGMVVTHQGRQIDFTPPWPRLTPAEALIRFGAATPEQTQTLDGLKALAANHGLEIKDVTDEGVLLLELFEHVVEEKLVQPTFIKDYPISVSPLSRRSTQNPQVADRFELFIGGWEIANAFSELNDPQDQAERFHAQVQAKEAGDLEAMHFDDDYIRALEYGMPPTGGAGIGIDRLVMLLTNAAAIRDVILFPQMRSRVEG
ncbi:MAG: lysine--tRNA ligase [Magnetococcales bacterium]|nr:lysine--tRNA ligase [Magnetococcales bacterium]MBF0150007.1 lysine--tRNA ligase [Magnetococcales bacterium]